MADKSFENVANFKYFGTTVTSDNHIHDDVMGTLNSRNACYHCVQSLAFSSLKNYVLKYAKP